MCDMSYISHTNSGTYFEEQPQSTITVSPCVPVMMMSVMIAVQAYVSRARVESFSLIADMMYVSSNAPRIARAVFEICLRRGWSSCAELALTLCKVTAPSINHVTLTTECNRPVVVYQTLGQNMHVPKLGLRCEIHLC